MEGVIGGETFVEIRVLVIYTGGTIGMKSTLSGFKPCKGYLPDALAQKSEFCEVRRGEYLVTPPSKFRRKIVYKILEYDPLLDSSNMDMNDWRKLATDIGTYYNDYDGFVVLHGTDTMAYTASALSFMLENLRKTVVITGSQIPMCEQRSDGTDNFLESLIIASHFQIPEVLICFQHKLFRGNRTTKVSSERLDAFGSPNFAPLATIGINIEIDWENVFRPPSSSDAAVLFRVHGDLCRDVAVLHLFPGITPATITSLLEPPIRGIIIKTYGSGNMPERAELLDVITRATNRGVVIVNCTQCMQGGVEAQYATGKVLVDAGVVPGLDMTLEAALSKLSWLLAQSNLTSADVRRLMSRNLRGEMTEREERFTFQCPGFLQAVIQVMSANQSSDVSSNIVQKALLPVLLASYAAANDVEHLSELISQGMSPNESDYDKRTPLHIAAAEGSVACAETLIRAGALVNLEDRYGHTALFESARCKHVRITELLREHGAQLFLSESETAYFLDCAVRENDQVAVESWTAAGANLNSADYDRRTPLHIASSEGNSKMMNFLLGHGADGSITDRWGTRADGLKV